MKSFLLVIFSILVSQSAFSGTAVPVEPTPKADLPGNTKIYEVKDGLVSCIIIYMQGISCSVDKDQKIDLARTESADLKFQLRHLSNNVHIEVAVHRRVLGNQLCYFLKEKDGYAGTRISCVSQ